MFKRYIGIAVLNLVVLVCIIAGLYVGGTPSELKLISLDTTRVDHFHKIQNKVLDYYNTNNRLPATLSELDIDKTYLTDPETNKAYEYATAGYTNFKLCTTFSLDSETINKRYPGDSFGSSSATNKHKQGYDCISYSARDESSINMDLPPEPLLMDAAYDVPESSSSVLKSDGFKVDLPGMMRLFKLPENPSYYLFIVNTFVSCDATSSKSCIHDTNKFALKTAEGVILDTNTTKDYRYTQYVIDLLGGPLQPADSIVPNAGHTAQASFYIPADLLAINKPLDVYMSYDNSVPQKITLTKNE